MEPGQGGGVVGGEGHPELGHPAHERPVVPGVSGRVDPGAVDVVEEGREGQLGPHREVVGDRPAIEEAEILHPVPGRLEQGLEEEMEQEIVPADVDDEGDLGLELGDVGEAGFGTDAEVGAARDAEGAEGVEGVEVGGFVGDEIVALEVAAGLRELLHQPAERRALDRAVGDGPQQREEEQDGEGAAAHETSPRELMSQHITIRG